MKNWPEIYLAQIKAKGGFHNFVLEKGRRSAGMLVKRMRQRIPPGSRILEVGAGTGAISVLLKEAGFMVTSIDSDAQMVEIAKKTFRELGAQITVSLADTFKLSTLFPRDSFECVVSHGLMEHFSNEEIERLLKEQLRVASLIIFVVPINSMSRKYRERGLGNERYLRTSEWKKFLASFGYVVHGVYGFGLKEAYLPLFPEIICRNSLLARILAPLMAFNEFWITKT